IIMMVAVAMLSCGKPSASIGNMKFASNNEQVIENQQDKNEIQPTKLDSFVIVPKIAVAQNQAVTQPAGTFYLPVNEQFQYIREGANTDMAFEFYLPENLTENDSVVLTYQLNGVQDFTSLIKKINNSDVVGGKFLKTDTTWYAQTEELPYFALTKGKNTIRYQLPDGVHNLVGIKDMQLQIIPKIKNDNGYIVVNQPNNRAFYRSFGYLQGFVNDDAVLKIDNKEVKTKGGFFECIVNRTKSKEQGTKTEDSWVATIEVEYPNGTKVERVVTFNNSIDYDFETGLNYIAKSTKQNITPENEFEISLLGATLFGNNNAVLENKTLSITALRSIDMAIVSSDIFNVTAESAGYRFLPDGQKFENQQVIALKYDTALIEKGYTPNDIFTFYYDEQNEHWQRIERDSIDLANCVIYSHTDHFTDYINGILKAPELPDVQAYTPTMIKDLQAAHPHTGIGQFSVPEANNKGTANTSMPLWLPAGRNGMQPNLSLSYSSGGGNGWLGQGWDIPFSSIEVETRWGVPLYDIDKETETYLLDGETLVLDTVDNNGNFILKKPTYRRPFENRNDVVKGDTTRFYRRVEGAFQKIIRHGSSPSNYYFVITNKDGLKLTYGQNASTKLTTANGSIGKWYLQKMEDLNGNFVEFIYQTVPYQQGKQIYIKEINYTGHPSAPAKYKIRFELATKYSANNATVRPDITSNARKGLLEVNAHLLDRIDVIYDTDTLRQYYFGYKNDNSSQGKTLLANVLDADSLFKIDDNFNLFSNANVFNRSANHSDASKYYPVKYFFEYTDGHISYGAPVKVFAGTDGSQPRIQGPQMLQPPQQQGSLGGSVSNSANLGGTLAVGYGFDSWWKSTTVGGNYSYNEDNSNAYMVMADLNGDGYPDKLFKDGSGNLHYRLHKIDNATGKSYFESTTHSINTDIKDFNKSNSHSNNWGLELQFFGKLGFDWSTSHNNTSVYLSDIDGDGLVDIVDADNNKVYFNRVGVGGLPTFTDKLQNDTVYISGASCEDDFIRIDGEVNDSVFYGNYIDSVMSVHCDTTDIHKIGINECNECGNLNIDIFDTIIFNRPDCDKHYIYKGKVYDLVANTFDNKCCFTLPNTIDTICSPTLFYNSDTLYYDINERCYIGSRNKFRDVEWNGTDYFTVVVDSTALDSLSNIHYHFHNTTEVTLHCDTTYTIIERKYNPLYAPDIQTIRAWIAPYSGKINITGNASLTSDLDSIRQKYSIFDGVKLTIQHSGNANCNALMKRDINLQVTDNVDMDTSFAVNAGDIVYFWVESKERHTLDVVKWNPIIEYSSEQTISTDKGINISNIYSSEHNNFVFNAANDFVLNGTAQNLKLPFDGDIKIRVQLDYNAILQEPLILKNTAYSSPNNIIDRKFSQGQSVTGYDTLITRNYVHQKDSLSFVLECPGKIDWTKADVKITVYYTAAYQTTNGTTTTLSVVDTYSDPNGQPIYTTSFTPVVGKKTYHYAKQPSQKVDLNFNNNSQKTFEPIVYYGSGSLSATNKSFFMTVKDENGNLITYGEFKHIGGTGNNSFNTIKPCTTTVALNGNYYIDFYVENRVLGNLITQIKAKINNAGSYNSGLYTNYSKIAHNKFENIYRGWTQFGYKPKDSTLCYIDESLLNLDYMSESAIDSTKLNDMMPANIGDSQDETSLLPADSDSENSNVDVSTFTSMQPEDELDGAINPLSGNFFIMNPDYKKKCYSAYTELASIRKDTMYNCFIYDDISTTISRVKDEGLPIPVVTAGEKPKTIIKTMTTKPYSFRIGGLFLGYAYSKSKTSLESDYMDMNGDRYPDIVGLKKVQYSKPQGGLSGKIENINSGEGINYSTAQTHSGSASTNSVQSVKQLASNIRNGDNKTSLRSSGGSSSNITGGQSGALSIDYSEMTWIDINGDGLPDKVDKNGNAYLNLGYKLSSNSINYDNMNELQKSTSFSSCNSIGGGYDYTQVIGSATKGFDIIYSISGGISNSTSNNMTKNMMMDVNADGLVDMIKLDNYVLLEITNNLVQYLSAGASTIPYTAPADLIQVAYNTGSGFTDWQNLVSGEDSGMGAQINYGDSYNFGANGALTVGFSLSVIPLKITVTIAGGGSWSVSSERYKFMDFNNDGYPDLVSTDNDISNISEFFHKPDSLMISYAKPTPSNLLAKIKNPTSLVMEIGYKMSEHSTTENPSRNWNMSSFKNGYSFIDCEINPNKEGYIQNKTSFEYKNRKYNRFEREDYGYKTVITKLYNDDNFDWKAFGQEGTMYATLTDNLPVSHIIEDTYDVSNYLFKGIKIKTTIKKPTSDSD
ncbi:MAG: hypothetical protein LBN95_11290, partial [Prevotellaceae bacterium]|nr:hypothetical protein [Prevotellaceae bacterium]